MRTLFKSYTLYLCQSGVVLLELTWTATADRWTKHAGSSSSSSPYKHAHDDRHRAPSVKQWTHNDQLFHYRSSKQWRLIGRTVFEVNNKSLNVFILVSCIFTFAFSIVFSPMLSKACQNRPVTHFWVATHQLRTAAVWCITIIASSLMADRWMALSKCHFWLQFFLFFPFHLSILPSPSHSPRLFFCPHLTLGRLASLPPSLLCLFPFCSAVVNPSGPRGWKRLYCMWHRRVRGDFKKKKAKNCKLWWIANRLS